VVGERHNCRVTTGGPLLVHDAIVALDYGQFCLCGSYGPSADYLTYLEEAEHGDRIAGNRQWASTGNRPPSRLKAWQQP
jgi:hypothetical protein